MLYKKKKAFQSCSKNFRFFLIACVCSQAIIPNLSFARHPYTNDILLEAHTLSTSALHSDAALSNNVKHRREALAFASPINYGVGPQGSASGMSSADFNKDGHIDLASGNNLLLGRGDGTFQEIPAPNFGYYSITDDLNHDGLPDVINVSYGSDTLGVYLGKGDGTFQNPSYSTVNSSPRGITANDFNRDGKVDLANTNLAGTISVSLGRGDGTFQTAKNFDVGPSAYGIVSADFNSDGYPDLANTNWASDTVSVLMGKGDGTFKTGVFYSVDDSPYWIATADFNGDGHPDLANTNARPGTVTVLLGLGNGSFKPSSSYSVINDGSWLRGILATDINGDGRIDIATADSSSDGLVPVLLGQGDGTFELPLYFSVGSVPWFIAAADFNNDGKIDLASSNHGDNSNSSISVLINNDGASTTTSTSVSSSTPSPLPSIFKITTYPSCGTYGITAGDMNRDGHLDLVTSSYDSTNSGCIFFSKGSGIFNPPVKYGPKAGVIGIAAGDFNGDGFSDLTSANWNTGNIEIYLTTTFGQFNMESYSSGNSPSGILTADFNHDGALDIANSNAYSNNVGVFLGYGNGTFRSVLENLLPFSICCQNLISGDVNMDGNIDLIVGSNSVSAFGVLLGRGDGTFRAPIITQLQAKNAGLSTSVALGDFNGDSKMDIAGIPDRAGNLDILLGDGTGNFKSYQNYTIPYGGALITADFTKDGNLDLALASPNSALIFLGNGKGNFGNFISYTTPGSLFGSLITGDFDQNSFPDLATISPDGGVVVLLNTLAPVIPTTLTATTTSQTIITDTSTSKTLPTNMPTTSPSTASSSWKDITIGVIAGIGGAATVVGIVWLIRKLTKSRGATLGGIVYDLALANEMVSYEGSFEEPPPYTEK